jgi:hypothetical protein
MTHYIYLWNMNKYIPGLGLWCLAFCYAVYLVLKTVALKVDPGSSGGPF